VQKLFTILALLALTATVAACGGESTTTAADEPEETMQATAAPPATTEQEESRCQPVPAALVEGIASGLTVTGGGSLRDAAAVRSDDFESAFFISAEVDGPGIEGDGDVGTWVTNRLEGGVIYSVDAVAREFSDWGDGGDTDAEFSLSDDGAEESRDCVD
jgi:hypothetical protein